MTTRVPERDYFVEPPHEEAWQDFVANSDVLLYGPSDSDGLEGTDFSSFKVLRSLTVGVLRWPATSDLAAGRCEVAYANGETSAWFQSLAVDQQEEAMQHWDFLVTKGHSNLPLSRVSPMACSVRGADSLSGLFISGSANMVPIMLVDALSRAPRRCFVAGVNFYLAESPYRSEHRGLDAQGRRKDELGSTGLPFQRCRSLAIHNTFENRTLVRNLYQAHAIQGDTGFESVMTLSDEMYAQGLSEVYGKREA